MKKIIVITATDIKKGTRGNARTCPIALACERAFPEHKNNVWIGLIIAKINGYRMALPKKAVNFITNFDRKKIVKPFKFVFKSEE